ncbi:MAG: alpha-galactosidase [Clostridiales bacterium]|nr:alpha-galactosidase [Clostridiales bacterium]
MAVLFAEKENTFTLHTDHTTYQMKVDPYGFLLHLYYGRRTEGCMDYLLTYADRGFSGCPYDAGNDRTYSMDVLPQELPCQGTGDYRSPAVEIRNADGSYGCDFRYRGYRIVSGKYRLPGLPAVYAGDGEAQTLEIDLEDSVSGARVTLLYGVLPELDIITRSACVTNAGAGTFYLEKAQAACLDFLSGEYDLITFYGRHAMERMVQRTPVAHGAQVIGSRRGTSSHQYNPMLILAGKGTTEDAGSCYAMSFVYSGNFKGEAERDQYDQIRVLLGISDELFSYPLEPGERFWVPETVLSYTTQGLAQLSANLHRCFRTHLCRGRFRDGVRPILLNSWEASYYDFDGTSILRLAEQAADLGVDMLVMDDGWFGKRDDDNSGLGDWRANEKKLGESLSGLVEKINALGLQFGIWLEPECVNEDSDLYRVHPDWAFAAPGRAPVRSRNQLVLDFSRPEVVDGVFHQICELLDTVHIEYVKWDMNRSLADCYSHGTNDQGRVMHDYVLGLYQFLERLTARYPDLLIEGCSGGGGRFDAGMLYYSPQIWCSDNTDALDRIRIQYGTSFGYPVSAVGSHVSAVPNHQTGRMTALSTRGVVAMAGTFGYELDPGVLTEEEKEEIREQIRTYRQYANLIRNGRYFRLTDPFLETVGAWEFLSEDHAEILVSAVTLEIHGNMTIHYVRLKGLRENERYRDEASGRIYASGALMETGIPLPKEFGEYRAYQMHLIRV